MSKADDAAREFEACLARSLDLCHSVGKQIEKNVLDVDTDSVTSANFKQKSTIGVMLSGTTVDNIVIGQSVLRSQSRQPILTVSCAGGPAYGKMNKGDVIKQVDGQKAKTDNIASLLYGSDVPGSEVRIEYLTAKGQAKKVVLRRMKVEAIADKHQMFHLFTEVKKAASKHNDSHMGSLVDKSIDHWYAHSCSRCQHISPSLSLSPLLSCPPFATPSSASLCHSRCFSRAGPKCSSPMQSMTRQSATTLRRCKSWFKVPILFDVL